MHNDGDSWSMSAELIAYRGQGQKERQTDKDNGVTGLGLQTEQRREKRRKEEEEEIGRRTGSGGERRREREGGREKKREAQRETETERNQSVIDYTALMNTVGCCGMNECWVLLFFVMEIVMRFDRLVGLALYRNVCYYHCYHYCYYSPLSRKI